MNVASLLVELGLDSKQFSDGLKGATGSAEATAAKITKSLTGAVAGFVTMAGAIKVTTDALKAQAAQEAAINKLNLALANQGKFTEATSKSLVDYSSALQDVSVYADDVILNGEALLASFGMNEEQIKKTTQAALDFSAATGKDLSSSFEVLGKAFSGNTGALSKYGVTVDQTLSKSKQFDAAVSQIAARFGGSALAETQTYAGGLKQLENAYGDVQEGLGKFLGELMGGGAPFATAIGWAKQLSTFLSVDLVIALSEVRARILEMIAGLAEMGPKAGLAMKVLARVIDPANLTGLNTMVKEMVDGGPALAKALRADAEEFRKQGDAAAAAAGKTQTFVNHVGGVPKPTDVAKGALKELRAELDRHEIVVRGVAAALDIQAQKEKEAADQVKYMADQTEMLNEVNDARALKAQKIVMSDQLDKDAAAFFKSTEAARKYAEQIQKQLDIDEALADTLSGVAVALDSVGFEGAANHIRAAVQWTDQWNAATADGVLTWGEMAAAIGGAINQIKAINDDPSMFNRVLGGAALGAGIGEKIGMLLGPMGAAWGRVIGALVGITYGILSGPKWAETGKVAGRVLGFEVSKELAKAIHDAKFKFGVSAEDASLLNLDKAMVESGKEASAFTAQALKLFDVVQMGGKAGAEAVSQIGKAFSALADEGGPAAEKAMIQLIQRARELGVEVKEIKAHVTEALSGATEGANTMLASFPIVNADTAAAQGVIFASVFWANAKENGIAFAANAAKESWATFQKAIEESGISLPPEVLDIFAPIAAAIGLITDEKLGPMVTGLDAATQAVRGLGDAGYMTTGAFDGLGVLAQATFDGIVAKTGDSNLALMAIAPTLAEIQQESDRYGLTIDDNTQALIDQANAAGIAFPTDPLIQVVGLLGQMVELLGGTVPESFKVTANAATTSLSDTTTAAEDAAAGVTESANLMAADVSTALNEVPAEFDAMVGALASSGDEATAGISANMTEMAGALKGGLADVPTDEVAGSLEGLATTSGEASDSMATGFASAFDSVSNSATTSFEEILAYIKKLNEGVDIPVRVSTTLPPTPPVPPVIHAALGYGPKIVGDMGGGLGPLIQTHAGEAVMVVPRSRVSKGGYFGAARGYGQEGGEGGGGGGGDGGSPAQMEDPYSGVSAEEVASNPDDSASASTASAVESLASQTADAIASISEAINELTARPSVQINASPTVVVKDESLIKTKDGVEEFNRTTLSLVDRALRMNTDGLASRVRSIARGEL